MSKRRRQLDINEPAQYCIAVVLNRHRETNIQTSGYSTAIV